MGDQKITAAQFDQIISSLPAQFQANARGPARKQFADNVVHVLVLAQEGKKRKLDETPRTRSRRMFQNANMLAGLAYEQLGKEGQARRCGSEEVLRSAQSGVRTGARAAHPDPRRGIADGRSLRDRKISPDAEALAKAQEIRKKIEAGGDFAATRTRGIRRYGQSGANGGDLGFSGINQMVPAFERGRLCYEGGRTQRTGEDPFGYHLIKVDEKTSRASKTEAGNRKAPQARKAQKIHGRLQKKADVQLDPAFFVTSPAPAAVPPEAPPALPPSRNNQCLPGNSPFVPDLWFGRRVLQLHSQLLHNHVCAECGTTFEP